MFVDRRLMIRSALYASVAIAACPLIASAQFVENFSDGELGSNPAWVGELEMWSVVPWGTDYALQSAGKESSDTLTIATASVITHGTWTFTLDYSGGQLSNFNQVRVYLLSDSPILDDVATGYYLQIGTNARDVRLYRNHATTSGRLLLGSAPDPALQKAESTVRFVATRTLDGAWTIRSNDVELFVAEDVEPDVAASAFFGIWLKHSAARFNAYRFDSIDVVRDDTPDITPPAVTAVAVENSQTLRVSYSETVDQSTACRTSAYHVVTLGAIPARAVCTSDAPTDVTLGFDSPLTAGRHGLVITGIADTSGNVLEEVVVEFDVQPEFAAPQSRSVVVNEIHYSPDDPELEFVELYNRSDSTFNLAELEIADSRSDFATAAPTTEALSPGGFAVIARNPDALMSYFTGVRAVAPATWPALNNSGDEVVIRYALTTIDSVAFSPSWGPSGVSLERVDPAGSSQHPSNWRPSLREATPGALNTAYAPDLDPPRALLAEMLGTSTLRIFFSEPIDPSTVLPGTVTIRSLNATSLEITDELTLTAVFPVSIEGESVGVVGLSDFSGNSIVATELAVARTARPRDIVINEIMYDPLADESDGRPDQPEYVEIASRSNDHLSLGGMHLTGVPDENGLTDTLAAIPPGTGLLPGSRAVLFAERNPVARHEVYSTSEIVLAFPLDYYGLGVPLISANSSRFTLRNDGRTLRLQNSTGMTIDSLTYSPLWHRSNVRDGKGIALERIDPEGSSSDPRNWTSSVAAVGGTPGLINSIYLSPEQVGDENGVRVQPSPFSPDDDGVDDAAGISFTLANPSIVRIRIFDSRGRLVRTLAEAELTGTSGAMIWDGLGDENRRLAAGVYVVLLEAFDEASARSERHKAAVVLARHLD